MSDCKGRQLPKRPTTYKVTSNPDIPMNRNQESQGYFRVNGHNGLNENENELILAAEAALERAFRPEQHTVGCAVRAASGKIYVGVNIKACGYGPCAEPIALGAAFTAGEERITDVVAVRRRENSFGYRVVSPCGNCRQLLVDYAPEATVILMENEVLQKFTASDLLPGYYRTRWNERLINGTNGKDKSREEL
jgi:cytidine deaminase